MLPNDPSTVPTYPTYSINKHNCSYIKTITNQHIYYSTLETSISTIHLLASRVEMALKRTRSTYKFLKKTSMNHLDTRAAVFPPLNRCCVEASRFKSKLTESSSSFYSPSTAKVVQQGLEVSNFLWYGSSKYLIT